MDGAPQIVLASFTLDAHHSVTQVFFFKLTTSTPGWTMLQRESQ